MGASPSLRQLLQGLCQGRPWEYAVFWKLNHRGSMMLTWEEGYCENYKMLNLQETELAGFYDRVPFGRDADGRTFQAPYPIELAVSRMSSHLYPFGNGIIGNVAFTQKYKWIFFSDFKFEVEEYPDEWQHQFAAGIKTILLVPVGQHGVVQLGSFELVEEDIVFVAGIKNLFNSSDNAGALGEILSIRDDSRTYAKSHLLINKDSNGLDIGHTTQKEQTPSYGEFTLPSAMKESPFLQSGSQDAYGMDMQLPIYGRSLDPMSEFSPVVPIEESLLYQDRSFDIDDPFLMESKSFGLTTEDMLFTFPQCHNDSPNFFNGMPSFLNSSNSEVKNKQYSSRPVVDEIDQPVITKVLESTTNEISSNISDLCTQSQKAGIFYEHDSYIPVSAIEDFWLSSPANHSSSVSEHDKVLINETNVEYLVNSLVAELYNASNEGVTDATSTERSSSDCSGKLGSCDQTQGKCQTVAACMDSFISHHSNLGVRSGNGIGLGSSPTGSLSSMNGSTLINEEKPLQIELGSDKCKSKKSVFIGKRKPKPDDNQRPRPRDRQLIQDRVKELRDLVPNAKKCSIDALLDRTIKHMMFLKNVSSQAEKLKKCSRSKVLGPDHEPLDFDDENYGMTWAYELDNQPEACPIVVKDLDQQGHMLVEMVCKEYSDFLEIAQVMRRLRLTILKGVMESRAENLRAHFVVETTKGFNRMEILWPLMQLLQQNRIPLSSRF